VVSTSRGQIVGFAEGSKYAEEKFLGVVVMDGIGNTPLLYVSL
jgi:hypothetical protein